MALKRSSSPVCHTRVQLLPLAMRSRCRRWLRLRWRRVKRLRRSHDGLHYLRFVGLVCSKGCNGHIRPAVRPVAHRAEKQQPASEDDDEKQEFATLRLEEIEQVARFHGLAGVCLAP